MTDILLRCGLSHDKLVGMAFDGASAMKCLARLVKENINPFAMYFHCFAHCNELVFKDATSSSPLIATSQDLCEDLYALVGVSPKRVLLFQSFQGGDGKSKTKNLSRTRWTICGPEAEILLHQHKECLATLSNLKDDVTVTPECRAKARGLLRKMQTFEDMFDLKAMQEIAILLEHNSKALQSSSLTAEEAVTSIAKVKAHFKGLRSDEEFDRLVKETSRFTDLDLADTMPTKRQKKPPSSMNDFYCTTTMSFDSPSISETTKLRARFFGAIDAVTTALNTRFNQEDLKKFQSIETLLLSSINKKEADNSLQQLQCFFQCN